MTSIPASSAYNDYGKLFSARCRRRKDWFVQLDPHQKYRTRIECLKGRQLSGLRKSRQKTKGVSSNGPNY